MKPLSTEKLKLAFATIQGQESVEEKMNILNNQLGGLGVGIYAIAYEAMPVMYIKMPDITFETIIFDPGNETFVIESFIGFLDYKEPLIEKGD
jgi:hypothetical protein